VLILTPDFPPAPGGIQLLMHRLASNLRRVRPRIVTLGHPAARAFDSQTPLEIVRVGRKGIRNRLANARLNTAGIREARRLGPAAVVAGHVVAAPTCAVLRRWQRLGTIQYVHADEFRTRPRLVRFALRHADAVISVSEHTRKLALEAGCEPRRVHVIPPGVDPPTQPRRPADRPTVVTVARLSDRYKGHDQMIRALPLIRARVPSAEWVVVGDGPLRPWLESFAASQGVAEAVRFVGSVSDQERDSWLARAHVFAMPSRLPGSGAGGEGFGIAYLEAAAYGLPVVAGAAAGAVEAVEDGLTGRLVDPTDHAALAEAIAELLLDPQRAGALGRAGADRARRFTWERHASLVDQLIQEVCGSAR
jgi:phosphatidylinositol alpha-1,6-mannosyltransferase